MARRLCSGRGRTSGRREQLSFSACLAELTAARADEMDAGTVSRGLSIARKLIG